MTIDLSKLVFFSKRNAFKNDNVHRGNLVVPSSIGANSIYTNSLTFTITDGVDFWTPFGYLTNYSDRISAGPPLNTYNDQWYNIDQIQDVFLVSSSGVINGQIIESVNGNTLTITLRVSRQGLGAVTVSHPTGIIPVSLVSYSLAA